MYRQCYISAVVCFIIIVFLLLTGWLNRYPSANHLPLWSTDTNLWMTLSNEIEKCRSANALSAPMIIAAGLIGIGIHITVKYILPAVAVYYGCVLQ